MSFGWYQELLAEALAEDLAAAESRLLQMLDRGGMLVHVYRGNNPENPELVGRHRRLGRFMGNTARAKGSDRLSREGSLPHEVERFLLDPAQFPAWLQARQTEGLLEQRWSVVELWPTDLPTDELQSRHFYGRALALGPIPIEAPTRFSLPPYEPEASTK